MERYIRRCSISVINSKVQDGHWKIPGGGAGKILFVCVLLDNLLSLVIIEIRVELHWLDPPPSAEAVQPASDVSLHGGRILLILTESRRKR